jgi:hypothetical protein
MHAAICPFFLMHKTAASYKSSLKSLGHASLNHTPS